MKIKNLFLLAIAIGFLAPMAVHADDYVDDIYFNPKKDKNVGAKKKNPNYIENFADMDVDTYNLRGQYYSTPIDTIGTSIGSEEDFVYTQQIQKYYNPTIVLDNSQLLADVLQNSYGNVEIVYNGITPAFLPTYGYGWPYYRGYYNPWAWNVSFGGWYDPWYWSPSWSWNWGPSWGWYDPWYWGPSYAWGPSWGWGPGWNRPGWNRPNGTWSPGGNRPLNPGAGWAGNHRPAPNRPAGMNRPGGSSQPSSGSQWSIAGNHRGSYGSSGVNSNKQNAPATGNNRGYTIGNNGHRYTGTGNGTVNNSSNSNHNNGNVGNNRTSGNSRGNSYNNSNTNSNRNNSSSNNRNTNTTRNSGSYNSGRSSGNGSFGSGSFGGGHRSTGGGGGGRGGRR